MSGVEGAECEDYDDGEAGVETKFQGFRVSKSILSRGCVFGFETAQTGDWFDR